MTAWASPGRVAMRALVEKADMRRSTARAAVETVFTHLTEPDRDMINAGAAELMLAVGKDQWTLAYTRNLAGVVWSAMIERARP